MCVFWNLIAVVIAGMGKTPGDNFSIATHRERMCLWRIINCTVIARRGFVSVVNNEVWLRLQEEDV